MTFADKDGKILAEDERDAQPPARKNANAPTTTTARPAAAKPPSPKKRVNVKTKRQNNQDMGGDESSQVCCHLQHHVTQDFGRGRGPGKSGREGGGESVGGRGECAMSRVSTLPHCARIKLPVKLV